MFKKSIYLVLFLGLCMTMALASEVNFNDTTNKAAPLNNPNFTGNVGIGTSLTNGALGVMSGNVGIGTWVPGSVLNVVGNVGIGSIAPNGALDVGAGSICLGHVCDSSWPAAGVNYWSLTAATGNVGLSTTNSVGIGTTSAGAGVGLVVMNGNVGIGTWVPGAALSVNGNIGIGTTYSLLDINNTANTILSLRSDTTSIYAGYQAGNTTTAGSLDNVALGGGALIGVTSGSQDVGIGYDTLTTNNTSDNTAVGYEALAFPTQNLNTAVGDGALKTATGANNTALGFCALCGGAFTGSTDTAVGEYAFNLMTTGYNNTGFGYNVQAQAVGDNNETVIGYGAVGSGGNTVTFGGTGTVSTDIPYGTLGVGTITPGGRLQVATPTTGPFFIDTNGNVGVGTILTNGGLSVMNGNVGIGTWVPGGPLQIGKPTTTPFLIDTKGNVGIGTTKTTSVGLAIMGNVGIGTWAPGNGALVEVDSGGTSIYGGSTAAGEFAAGVEGFNTSFGVGVFGSSSSGYGVVGYSNAGLGNGAAFFAQSGNNTPFFVGGAFEVDANGNVGIGTTYPQTSLVVTNGNVGIGTWVVGSALNVVGNVGIGSIAPNGALDLGTGSLCLNHTCVSIWPNGSNYWSLTTATGNVGVSTTNSVGIGTTSAGAGAGLLVMNGNMGIGTWVPADLFQVGKYKSGTSGFEVDANGNVGIGTTITNTASLSVMNGNVGIGTWAPRAPLEVDSSGTAIYGISNVSQVAIQGSNLNFGTGIAAYSEHGIGLEAVGSPAIYTVGANGAPQALFGPNNGLSVQVEVDTNGNVGIGTALLNFSALSVMAGNVGIGTWIANSALNVVGNVGIGSIAPNGALDVGTGSICLNHVCDSSWPSISGGNYWLLTTGAGNVGISTIYTVGIGTSSADSGAGLIVMNGNVGIGTWVPSGRLQVGGLTSTPFLIDSNGNVGIGTTSTSRAGLAIMNGNVGIGTIAPNGALDVGTGSICLNHTCNANWVGSNYWSLTAATGNVGVSTSNTLGIGTTSAGAGAGLVVMNGNVGIGTWVPSSPLSLAGNIGIGTSYNIVDISNTANTILTLRADISSVYVGYQAGASISGDSYSNQNAALGYQALNAAIGGYENGNNNTAAGAYALSGLTTGWDNSALGYNAGRYASGLVANQTSNNSVYLGYNTEALNNGDTNETVIGANAIGNGSNTITLGGTGTLDTAIPYGNLGIGTALSTNALDVASGGVAIGASYAGYQVAPSNGLIVQGNVGIGTWAPSENLEVNGIILADVSYQYPNGFGVLADNGGNLYVPQALFDSAASSGTSGYCLTSTGTQVTWGVCTATGGGGSTPASPNFSVQFDNGGSFGGSANFFFNGTNVGIGTSLSANTLDVATNVSIGTTYAGYKSVPANGLAVQGNVGIGTWTPRGAFQVGTANTALVVATTGNVGIGTSSITQGFLQVGVTSRANDVACWGTNNCAGFCGAHVSSVTGLCACTCINN